VLNKDFLLIKTCIPKFLGLTQAWVHAKQYIPSTNKYVHAYEGTNSYRTANTETKYAGTKLPLSVYKRPITLFYLSI